MGFNNNLGMILRSVGELMRIPMNSDTQSEIVGH